MNHYPIETLIREAHERIRPYIHRTPLFTCETLNRLTGSTLIFKGENFQKAGAFKSRGAVNAVFSLPENEIVRGVATHSSGNHAAALARAASLRSIPAYIVMPENSSNVKVAAVKQYGGRITFCKPTLQAREETLLEILQTTGATEIHPYNNYRIIAGQATAALELIEQADVHFDVIMAPVGGGGLLSGTALSTACFSPGTITVAAEPAIANDAHKTFQQKEFIPADNTQTIADGLRTSLGTLTYPIILEKVNDILLASEEGIVTAMRLMWERMKVVVEPSSAVPLAALLENPGKLSGKTIGIIISGGNVDLSKLPF